MKNYLKLAKHYETCFEREGDNHLGVDWPNQADAQTRYRVMLDCLRPGAPEVSLLDFGCGTSHLYEHLIAAKRTGIVYTGADISAKFVAASQRKFPQNRYLQLDILEDASRLGQYDYVVANGVFTEKRELTFDEMYVFFTATVQALYRATKIGLAFNVMSKHVAWERDDLFHLPYDVLASFLTKEVSRHFQIRADYGLYEYTVYVYRNPSAG